MIHSYRGGGITGDDQGLYRPGQDLLHRRNGQSKDLFLRPVSVGGVGRVAKIKVALSWHKLHQPFQHADAAHTGVEYRDIALFVCHKYHRFGWNWWGHRPLREEGGLAGDS